MYLAGRYRHSGEHRGLSSANPYEHPFKGTKATISFAMKRDSLEGIIRFSKISLSLLIVLRKFCFVMLFIVVNAIIVACWRSFL